MAKTVPKLNFTQMRNDCRQSIRALGMPKAGVMVKKSPVIDETSFHLFQGNSFGGHCDYFRRKDTKRIGEQQIRTLHFKHSSPILRSVDLRRETPQTLNSPERKLHEARVDIIEGRDVKRIKHELRYDGRDISNLFIERLGIYGYQLTTVANVDVKPGERAPAFYIKNTVAYFGWFRSRSLTSVPLKSSIIQSLVRSQAAAEWEQFT